MFCTELLGKGCTHELSPLIGRGCEVSLWHFPCLVPESASRPDFISHQVLRWVLTCNSIPAWCLCGHKLRGGAIFIASPEVPQSQWPRLIDQKWRSFVRLSKIQTSSNLLHLPFCSCDEKRIWKGWLSWRPSPQIVSSMLKETVPISRRPCALHCNAAVSIATLGAPPHLQLAIVCLEMFLWWFPRAECASWWSTGVFHWSHSFVRPTRNLELSSYQNSALVRWSGLVRMVQVIAGQNENLLASPRDDATLVFQFPGTRAGVLNLSVFQRCNWDFSPRSNTSHNLAMTFPPQWLATPSCDVSAITLLLWGVTSQGSLNISCTSSLMRMASHCLQIRALSHASACLPLGPCESKISYHLHTIWHEPHN